MQVYIGPEELPDNDLVLGLEIGTRSKAYPLSVVTEARVINDWGLYTSCRPTYQLG